MTETGSEGAATVTARAVGDRPAGHRDPEPAGLADLRRVGANPDFWYPVAVSGGVRRGKVLATAFAGSGSRCTGGGAAPSTRWRTAAPTVRCR